MTNRDDIDDTFAAYVPGDDVPILSINGTWIRRGDACGPVDIDGKPVTRTKANSPYSYECHVIWRGGPNSEWDAADYDDRLYQWNRDKFRAAAAKHMPDKRFDNAAPSQVEAFLREYHGDPGLRLVVIQEGANVSSGSPYWVFHYKRGSK